MKLRNVNWKSAFLASALLAASSVPAAAAIVYQQPFDGTGNFFSSQNDTNTYGNFSTTYDNFTLAATTYIYKVDWTGAYFFPATQAPIAGFTIDFWADNSGSPGTLLSTQYITGTANETSLGTFGPGFYPFFTYSAAVTPFAAAAGTQYWLSIVPDLGFPPEWGWATGTGGDGAAYQIFGGVGAPISHDLAFALETPEPFSFSLAAIGLGLVGLASWRLRRQSA